MGISFTPQLLCPPGKSPHNHWIGGCISFKPGPTGTSNPVYVMWRGGSYWPYRDFRLLSCPTSRQSLYRPCYIGSHILKTIFNYVTQGRYTSLSAKAGTNFTNKQCCSVGIVRSQAKATELLLVIRQGRWSTYVKVEDGMTRLSAAGNGDYLEACRSQWPRDLRHELSSPAPTLRSWVRIPLEACMFVCVLCAFILCLHSLRWDSQPT
jgi:hypothetical protein